MSSEIFKNIQSSTVGDLLNKLKGQEITLLLSTGERLSGRLSAAEVNYTSQLTKLVHLTELSDQSYFDAMIPVGAVLGLIIRNPEK